MALTKRQVEKLREPGRYGDGQGLYLQVLSPTNRSWLLRYERGGRERYMGLGPVHTVDLAEARSRARKARLQLLDGIDPLDARAAERTRRTLEAARTITFETAAREYFKQHSPKWKNRKHAQQFNSTMRDYVLPKIGSLPVADIDTGLVLRCVEPIWQDKTETASRVRARIENVLGWCTVRGFRQGENPARWRGHLENVLPSRDQLQKVNHHPALPWAELPQFMTALREREGIAARALEFTILTAARTSEVTGATWAEINFKDAVWTIPAGRIKGGREHRVPLSAPAVELLRALPREEGNPAVFLGARTGGLSSLAMASALGRVRPGVTVHGFRSTFRDWCAESTAYPQDLAELALAHAVGNSTERAYRRGDQLEKRRRLMTDWAKFATTAPTPNDNKVLPLRKGAHALI